MKEGCLQNSTRDCIAISCFVYCTFSDKTHSNNLIKYCSN